MKTAKASLLLSSVLVAISGCAESPSEGDANASESAISATPAFAKPNFQGNPNIPEAYNGDVIASYFTVAIDETTVRSFLPAGVELAAQALTPRGTHPVIFVHNDITRLEAPGVPPIAYHEWLTWVPALRAPRNAKCATADGIAVHLDTLGFMPKLLLDLQMPVDVGVNFYGYNKFLTTVQASNAEWKVWDVSAPATAAPFYDAKFGAEKPLSTRGKLNQLLEASVLSNALIGQMRDSGILVWSGIEFSDENATALEGATVDIDSPLFGHQHLDVASLNDNVLGAWRLRAKFRGSAPAPCTQ